MTETQKLRPFVLPKAEDVLESEKQVLARYGKRVEDVPKIMLAAADATRLASKKLVEEAAAGIVAAEKILAMLKEEHETYKAEVLRHSENCALRLTEYLTRCHVAMQSMARHREAISEVAEAVASTPSIIETATRDDGNGEAEKAKGEAERSGRQVAHDQLRDGATGL